MSRAKCFLVVLLAFSSVCVGARLMQNAVARPNLEQSDSPSNQVEPACQALVQKHQNQMAKKMAQELYQQALKLSFAGQWEQAREASECAAWLEHGTKKWSFEAKDLIN